MYMIQTFNRLYSDLTVVVTMERGQRMGYGRDVKNSNLSEMFLFLKISEANMSKYLF